MVPRSGDPTLIRYLARRALHAVPVLIGIVTLIFVILHLAPGDPTTAYFHPDIPPEVLERMRAGLGLDEPLHVQYLNLFVF